MSSPSSISSLPSSSSYLGGSGAIPEKNENPKFSLFAKHEWDSSKENSTNSKICIDTTQPEGMFSADHFKDLKSPKQERLSSALFTEVENYPGSGVRSQAYITPEAYEIAVQFADHFTEFSLPIFDPNNFSKISNFVSLLLLNTYNESMDLFEIRLGIFKVLLNECDGLSKNEYWNSLPRGVQQIIYSEIIYPKLKTIFIKNYIGFDKKDLVFLCTRYTSIQNQLNQTFIEENIPNFKELISILQYHNLKPDFGHYFEEAIVHRKKGILLYLIENFQRELESLKLEHSLYNCWHIIAQYGDMELFRFLMEKGFSGFDSQDNYEGVNIAFIAVKNNHYDFIESLFHISPKLFHQKSIKKQNIWRYSANYLSKENLSRMYNLFFRFGVPGLKSLLKEIKKSPSSILSKRIKELSYLSQRLDIGMPFEYK